MTTPALTPYLCRWGCTSQFADIAALNRHRQNAHNPEALAFELAHVTAQRDQLRAAAERLTEAMQACLPILDAAAYGGFCPVGDEVREARAALAAMQEASRE